LSPRRGDTVNFKRDYQSAWTPIDFAPRLSEKEVSEIDNPVR